MIDCSENDILLIFLDSHDRWRIGAPVFSWFCAIKRSLAVCTNKAEKVACWNVFDSGTRNEYSESFLNQIFNPEMIHYDLDTSRMAIPLLTSSYDKYHMLLSSQDNIICYIEVLSLLSVIAFKQN